MAAIDLPWHERMSSSKEPTSPSRPSAPSTPVTRAAFSPTSISQIPSNNKNRSTIIVQQKSPLLIATPPQITRVLAYSHPFILPLNRFLGLLIWDTDDHWSSFLLVACFWLLTLYGDTLILYAGPLCLAAILVLGLWLRRFSPISSSNIPSTDSDELTATTSKKHPPNATLDDIVANLERFTARSNILISPLIQLTDYLSTQTTATRATTRPALTHLFIRLLAITPFWTICALPPFHVVTARRLVLSIGTLLLTYHSRQARVTRALLWRSKFVRRVTGVVTGLSPPLQSQVPPNLPARRSKAPKTGISTSTFEAPGTPSAHRRRPSSPGVKFTFALYENQRKWLGLGWTNSLLAYERSPWSDEHHNASPPKEHFSLPETNDPSSRWRWVGSSRWRVENAEGVLEDGTLGKGEKRKKEDREKQQGVDEEGWVYYDNKWTKASGRDGWGAYTRRRKWVRDAELVEVTSSTEVTPAPTPKEEKHPPTPGGSKSYPSEDEGAAGITGDEADNGSLSSKLRRRFQKSSGSGGSGGSSGRRQSHSSARSEAGSLTSIGSKGEKARVVRGHDQDSRDVEREIEKEWNTMDDAKMALG